MYQLVLTYSYRAASTHLSLTEVINFKPKPPPTPRPPRTPPPATCLHHLPHQSDGVASTEGADEYMELSLAVLDQTLFVPVAYALLDICPRTSSV